MKKTVSYILFAVLALVSCVKEVPEAKSPLAKSGNYFVTTPSTLDIPAAGGEITLDISTNVLWTLTLSDGLYAYSKSGVGSMVVPISVPANISFRERTFRFEVSTKAELDDDKEWSVTGKTDRYVINQEGVDMIFSVDTNKVEVPSIATSAEIILNQNVGYTVEDLTPSLTCVPEEIADNCHKLVFSFPKNEDSSPKTYTATIKPKEGADVLDPITIEIVQDEFVKTFELDTNSVSLVCFDTSASVVLTENLGYTVSCSPASVTYTVEEQSDGVHKLIFTFPQNTQKSRQTYTVTITPVVTSPELVKTFTITHCENVPFVIDCTDATVFRYLKNGVLTPFSTSGHGGADLVECDFWIPGMESYVFHGEVQSWSKTLNAKSNSKVSLPKVANHILYSVDFTYSYATADRDYYISDGVSDLGTARAGRTLTGTAVLDRGKAVSEDRYLYSKSEMCCKFILNYYPNK